MEELDLPGVLARAPELCLIDELAHTNAPGVEHSKRFEDVDDVLAAGIDVFSTMNVQHLESLNDNIAELSGVRVRETVPDSVLQRADEIVIVDLTPEALLERLRAGKVYPAERVDAALQGFFKIENLSALRETALRQVAQEVESRRRVEGADGPAAEAAIGERLLALVEPYPGAQRLVRRAWRSRAAARGRPRPAVGPQTGAAGRACRRRPSARCTRCVSSRRCSVPSCWSRRATMWPRRLRAWPCERGTTYILLGASRPARGLARLREPLAQRLVRLAPGVDVRIVADRSRRGS